jgi:16S rRNA (cytosine967-C5)-methyltransferase
MSHLRFFSAQVMAAVMRGHSLSDRLMPACAAILKDPRDRSFVQAVAYGICRFYPRLDFLLRQLLQKPLKAKEVEVRALLLVGLYQLLEMRVPNYAAVTETVKAAAQMERSWAGSLVNAVLRECLRRKEQIPDLIASDLEAQYAHSAWWMERIRKSWPEQEHDILLANNQRAPFTLRVNARRMTREAYIDQIDRLSARLYSIARKPMRTEVVPETTHGVILQSPLAVEELPGFMAGDVSIQDGAAQLAAGLLQLAPGQYVLDACAAPGGKLLHILESEPHLAGVVALEKEERRMRLLKENLTRLHYQATCLCVDAAEVKTWWKGRYFDRVLLDAPCSGSGVVRRHPDIKLLRQRANISLFAREQMRLLTALWTVLKPGGLLLYATCSIFPEENVQVLQRFLAFQPTAKEEPLSVSWGLPCAIGRQILPGMHQMDGFYYACLRK